MSSREIAEAKKCALTTLDWDTYQVIIRTCLSTVTSMDNKTLTKVTPAKPLLVMNRGNRRSKNY